jgi:FAD/FMN-containing dehydrogenase
VERFVVDRLRAMLPGQVTTGMDPDYDLHRTTFNATVQRKPAIIVRIRSVNDVVSAVVAATDLGLPIAVRGGGHSVAGHGMADAALVVDLRDQRVVTVDPTTGIVRVAGGAQWDDVDQATGPRHLAVVGGTIGDTGVAGLTLGGGIGWLTGIQGFTCDRLIRAEVVTADGGRVVAGPEGDPELLWALRGGGGNFGVVTSFEFQASDPGQIIGGYLTYPVTAVSQVLRRTVEMAATAPDALELMALIGRPDAQPGDPWEQDDAVIRIGVCWPGGGGEADAVLRPLRAGLPVIGDDIRPIEYPEIQAMSGRIPFGLRHYWKGHFLRELDESLIREIVEAYAVYPGRKGAILLESIRGAGHREPDGGAAFGQRAATWNASALAIWEDQADDQAQIGWARATTDRFAPNSLTGAGYANYAPVDETIERVRLSFGTERFTRLAAVKRRYDPGNRFRFNLNVAPS